MIGMYLTSVFIWALMIGGTVYLFQDKIRENGWLDNLNKSNKNPWVTLFLMSAIPVVRIVFFFAALVIVGMTKEEFEKLQEELKDESRD